MYCLSEIGVCYKKEPTQLAAPVLVRRGPMKRPIGTYLVCLLLSCSAAQRDRPSITSAILSDRQSHFYLDRTRFPQERAHLPIGVFDSGTGGLTVLDAIIALDQYDNGTHRLKRGGDGKKDFAREHFVYLGDNANMPYGNYSKEGNAALLVEHVIKDARFLLGTSYYRSAAAPVRQTDKQPAKVIVIACNTATAFGKSAVERLLDRTGLGIQVIGIIGAGARGALGHLAKGESGSIGILATAGTVASRGYVKMIEEQARALGYTGAITTYQQAGLGLAGAIDGIPDFFDAKASAPRGVYKGPSPTGSLQRYGFDWEGGKVLFDGNRSFPRRIQLNSVDNYIAYHLVSLLDKIRRDPGAKPLRAIILGCTHYTFYKEKFREKLQELREYQENGKFLYRHLFAAEVVLVDPALSLATELYRHLADAHLLNGRDNSKSEFYISVPNRSNPSIELDSSGKSFSYRYKYSRRAGKIQQYVKQVPFSRRTLSKDMLDRLSSTVPAVFELIHAFNHDNPKTAFLKDSDRI